MARLEKDEEYDLCKRVKRELGVESIKLNLHGNKGWPDRMFLLPGKPAWIELKRIGEEPYKLQDYRLKQMLTLGYDVIWTSDYEYAFQWLKELQAARLSGASDNQGDRSGLHGTSS